MGVVLPGGTVLCVGHASSFAGFCSLSRPTVSAHDLAEKKKEVSDEMLREA